jgi:3-phosphoshikimate 1-carboxyvinyltransferase
MKSFDFKGEISSSKSYFNRALILSHYKNSLHIEGKSESRDVLYLQKALQSLNAELEVGEGGTTFRFLSFLVSRKPGIWKLKGSSRLFARPQLELKNILNSLGVEVTLSIDSIIIDSDGWKKSELIHLDLSQSSQFASGLILNSWGLPFELSLQLSREKVSDGYLEMTLDLVRRAGMKLEQKDDFIKIPAHQEIQIESVQVEPDVSSAFVVASLAAGRGHCEIKNFPFQSLQPDLVFLDLFEKMQVPIEKSGDTLIVNRALEMKPIEVSLKKAPDLFPVFCVLLTKTKGRSQIYDTPQLIHKESNRLQKTSELLSFMKVEHEVQKDGIVINSSGRHHHEFFEFDPDQDHRLAFAAALAKSFGYRTRIKNPQVVDKSFPGFWNLIGGGPG